MPKILRIAFRAAVLVVATLAVYRYAWLPYRANRVLFETNIGLQQAESYNATNAARAVALAHANIAQLQSVAPACRTSVEYELLYAASAALLHRWDEAFTHYNAALQIDHRPEIYFNRGLTRLQLGDIAGATQDLVIAVRFRPVLNDQLSGELHDRVAAQAGIK